MVHLEKFTKTGKWMATALAVVALLFVADFVTHAQNDTEETVTTVLGAVLETESMDPDVDTIVSGAYLDQQMKENLGFVASEAGPLDLAGTCTIHVQPETYVYSGQKYEPAVSVVYENVDTGESRVLTRGTDYQVAYEDNKYAGTGKVLVTGMGDYVGSKTAEFQIEPNRLDRCQVCLDYTEVYGDGSEQTPGVKVFYKGVALSKGNDYKVTYRDHIEAGTATVTITGINSWTGSVEETFLIKYRAVEDFSFMPSNGMLSLTWGKIAGASGYEVFRSTSANAGFTMLGTTAVNAFTDQDVSYSTTYFYKIRAFGTIEGKKVYGAETKPMEVTASEHIAAIVAPYEGARYVYGGTSPNGWDCSGFVQWIMKNKFGVNLPRTSREQAKCGISIDKNDQSEWMPGDILCFSSNGRVCHVGLYIGGGKMIHAANERKGTVIVDINEYNRLCTVNRMTHVRRVL